ncbi:carotenoid-cleaving dioxygenase, mitochondrial-like isoform 2-T2 [Discoglossus pictus]
MWAAINGTSVLKNFFSKEEKEPFSSTGEGKECIAPLFQTVQETPHPIPAKTTGTIPTWINGSLLRNGPGKFEFGEDRYKHWFDGMALLHKFTIDNGAVTYMSAFLQSENYETNTSQNRIAVPEFGTTPTPDPKKSIIQTFVSAFELPEFGDNGNINFMKYKNDYYVGTETTLIHKVDPAQLQTKERVDLSQYIRVNGATAHPHYEADGTAYNIGNSYGIQGTCYNIFRVPASAPCVKDSWGQVVCSIPAKEKIKCSYYHSFGMTENYIIFVEQPIKLNILKIVTNKITGSTISDAMTWEPNYDTVFNVINKNSWEIHPVVFYAKPFATFHQINAFEDHGSIVFDICCLDDGRSLNHFLLENLHKSGQSLEELYNAISRPFPRRFVLPLNIDSDTEIDVNLNPLSYTTATTVKGADGKVWCTPENLYDQELEQLGGLEFPNINYSMYNTRRYRYFYGCGLQHIIGSCLVKMNIETKKPKIWQEDGFYPSEPVFIPSPGGSEEDDGVILSVMVTPRQDKNTFLLVLDAKTFTEMGRAEVPVQIPYGFHGVFVSQEQHIPSKL